MAASRWWMVLLLATTTLAKKNRTKLIFELDAEREWVAGSDLLDAVADGTILSTTSRIRTQCYSGNEKYLLQKVLCDRECLQDVGAVTKASGMGSDTGLSELRCNGPWYCSRTEICELYRKESLDDTAAFERSCTVVYGCANHSQCFPSPEEQRRMNIDMHLDSFDLNADQNEIRDQGFTVRYGGVTMTTTCCANNRGPQRKYKLFIDQPCNSASRRTVASLALATSAFAILASTFL
eukprot:CAMPEP_0197414166 /NCGR_PEP_ID=MMETSP1170-20131217/925_1 /TAXON_ID=54406 /ORGANISM="Sarcinochrysis sp, Strain CCMP770" /LENGTH=236 /DNA_ID=CAMNT_0042940857 /DNA_START=38 /DNA_END=748 /DNA_ORIENTATION=+